MNILVCLDENYIRPLKVMLYSLFRNNENSYFTIYIMHSQISDESIEDLKLFVEKASNSFANLVSLKIGNEEFETATTTFHYTKEMYYRLIAFEYLPRDLDRILYLDPDILVLNRVDSLYNTDMDDYIFAASIHTTPGVQEVNRVRFQVSNEEETPKNYYNSGVLMINLDLQRELVKEEEIVNYVNNAKKMALIMPDQDLLNVVFQDKIKTVSELKYNYDARRYPVYKLMYEYADLNYVMKNTVFLHFCGKQKPRLGKYNGKFESIYSYFWNKAEDLSRQLQK